MQLCYIELMSDGSGRVYRRRSVCIHMAIWGLGSGEDGAGMTSVSRTEDS